MSCKRKEAKKWLALSIATDCAREAAVAAIVGRKTAPVTMPRPGLTVLAILTMFRKNVRKGRTTTRSTDDEMGRRWIGLDLLGMAFDDGAGEVVAEVLVVVTKISHNIYSDELDVRINSGNIYCQQPHRRQGIARF